MNEDTISMAAAKAKKVYSEERHEYVVPVAELDWLPSVPPQVAQGSPCDLCRYDPPSSCDGKPCTMCPAEAKMNGGESKEGAP